MNIHLSAYLFVGYVGHILQPNPQEEFRVFTFGNLSTGSTGRNNYESILDCSVDDEGHSWGGGGVCGWVCEYLPFQKKICF